MDSIVFIALVAGIAVCLTCIGAAIGISMTASKTVESMARQPEAASKVQTLGLIAMAFIEATAIYGLLIGILLFTKM